MEEGRAVGGELSAVFDESDAAVFVADNQVMVAVFVPVEGDGNDHLEVHRERIAGGGFQALAGGVARSSARADVFEVGEAIEEFATEEVEVAVVVKIFEVGGGAAECFGAAAVGFEEEGLG